MNLPLGVGLLAAAIVMFTWALAATRRTDPPRWARHQGVTGAFALGFTMLSTVGAGFLIAGLFDLGAELRQLGLTGSVALVGIAGGGIWATQRLRRPAAPVAADAGLSVAKPA
ncbi:hypothetical protein ACRDNQ_01805 [Palleronia sp. KMU-117]|uniref:hypothetical protein n=1 Tax=Palleronia sp. KMU-117 TaxID=3434108 RepID=UPI003D74E5B1